MEASRKRGSYDTRWVCVRKDVSSGARGVTLRAAEVAEALDWDTFSARHFGDRGRDDSEARSAYAAYRQGREWREIGAPGLSLVPPELVPAEVAEPSDEAGTRRLLAAMVAADPRDAHGSQPDQQ
jgi:hypothetical protein